MVTIGSLYFLDLENGGQPTAWQVWPVPASLDSDLVHFFEDGTKLKIPSEITSPLPLADLIYAEISFGCRPLNVAVQIVLKQNW